MDRLKTLSISSWQENFNPTFQTELTESLEKGQVLFMPALSFQLTAEEKKILSQKIINPKTKNISFNQLTKELRGVAKNNSDLENSLIYNVVSRFSQQSLELINQLFPQYQKSLIIGRTSFRPVEIKGRMSSYRKDDTRLHVDAFPANPNHGWRILRVFSNINPNNQPRVWRLGEPFEIVAKQFLNRLKKPIRGSHTLLHLLKITKKRRTLYDHYMLQLHDNMKADEHYQKNADQAEIQFPANTTWVVQTDHVSHAAMSGQHLLEQTFYLPVNAMANQQHAPLRVLEKLLQRPLA